MTQIAVQDLPSARRAEAVEALVRAYRGDPLFRSSFWRKSEQRVSQLYGLFQSACAIQYSYHPPLAVVEGESVCGVANYVGPSSRRSNRPLVRLHVLWAQVVGGGRLPLAVYRRMRAYSAAAGALLPKVPKLIVTQLGVVPEASGRGIASALLARVFEAARRDPRAQGVGITTYSESNARLYRHAGFAITGHTVVDGVSTWALFAETR